MDKRFLLILGLVILGLIGLFVFSKNNATAPSGNSKNSEQVSNHTKGKKDSSVKLLVYGDFECSACVAFYPTEKAVVDKYIDKIAFTFKHFPLDGSHPNARAASRAAEAAGLQGKFFEMHDLLYEFQTSWVSRSDPLISFTGFAKELKLDIEKFKTDYASESVNSTINSDYKHGQKLGVDGTPTYFLNDKKLDLADIQTVEQFSSKIDEALKAN
jgi:protein-disulfide isomerase